jgi:hypothetical protein
MNTTKGISITWVLALASILLTPQKPETSLPPIAPKQVQAEFSRRPSSETWTEYIYSTGGTKLYVLSLERELDAGKHIADIDLVLRDVDKRGSVENLLSPPRPWHGLQPYNFAADDLSQGATKSAFGAKRTIVVRSRNLVLSIEVVDVKVSGMPGKTHELRKLKLSVSVENLPQLITER